MTDIKLKIRNQENYETFDLTDTHSVDGVRTEIEEWWSNNTDIKVNGLVVSSVESDSVHRNMLLEDDTDKLLDQIEQLYDLYQEYDVELVDAAINNWYDLASAKDAIDERYQGEYDNFRDYVEETFLEVEDVPSHLITYLDWDKIANDWEYSHTVLESPNGVYVFTE